MDVGQQQPCRAPLQHSQVLHAPQHIYKLGQRAMVVPYLAPSLSYVYEVGPQPPCLPAQGASITYHLSLFLVTQSKVNRPASRHPACVACLNSCCANLPNLQQPSQITPRSPEPIQDSAIYCWSCVQVEVTCIDPNAGADTITVILLSRHSSLPILQATLKMPMSELPDE
jgi:hypothetical protein